MWSLRIWLVIRRLVGSLLSHMSLFSLSFSSHFRIPCSYSLSFSLPSFLLCFQDEPTRGSIRAEEKCRAKGRPSAVHKDACSCETSRRRKWHQGATESDPRLPDFFVSELFSFLLSSFLFFSLPCFPSFSQKLNIASCWKETWLWSLLPLRALLYVFKQETSWHSSKGCLVCGKWSKLSGMICFSVFSSVTHFFCFCFLCFHTENIISLVSTIHQGYNAWPFSLPSCCVLSNSCRVIVVVTLLPETSHGNSLPLIWFLSLY